MKDIKGVDEVDSIQEYVRKLEKEGYIGMRGNPLMCMYCNSPDLVDVNMIKTDYGIKEYEVQCNYCKKITGRWAYGNWAIL